MLSTINAYNNQCIGRGGKVRGLGKEGCRCLAKSKKGGGGRLDHTLDYRQVASYL
jgi:hypothetical protein